ncbi:MAG: hypothetical protein Q9167_003502 [Letrouitia subvulpina]
MIEEAEEKIEKYTDSVKDFLVEWQDKTYQSISQTSKKRPTLAGQLEYVNMQNYSGGQGPKATDYQNDDVIPNLKPSQILHGIDVEDPANRNEEDVQSLDSVLKKVQDNGLLGGVMVWRLNSDNWIFQNMLHVALHNNIHGKESPHGLEDLVKKGWKTWGPEYVRRKWGIPSITLYRGGLG